jgi:large subunit ribosomal protein L23
MSSLRKNSEKLYDIIKRPLVTEKSTEAIKAGQYSFEVVEEATKIEIKQAVELIFPGRKVKKVRTIYMPSHEKRLGRKFGRTQSGRKAIVTIEGEPITELMMEGS